MAGYQRKTALSPKEVLAKADEVIPEIVGLTRSKGTSHDASFSGEEGTVTLSAIGMGLTPMWWRPRIGFALLASTTRSRSSSTSFPTSPVTVSAPTLGKPPERRAITCSPLTNWG